MRGCETCARLLAENEALTSEVSGLLDTTRRQAKTIAGLNAEITRRAATSPRAETIRRVAEHWLRDHPRAKVPVGGKRWQTIDRALRAGHTPDELVEALDGLAARPFVTEKGRSATGTPAQRYDDLALALRDETTIERFKDYLHAHEAPASPAPPAEASSDDPYWQHVAAQAGAR
jgi:hypothetical protein